MTLMEIALLAHKVKQLRKSMHKEPLSKTMLELGALIMVHGLNFLGAIVNNLEAALYMDLH